MKICGIDEAGRGAVLGPMVIAGVLLNENDLIRLQNIGVRNSKELTRKAREKLFEKIVKICRFKVYMIEAWSIDYFRERGVNLNQIEVIFFSRILSEFIPDRAYIDSPSVNREKVKNLLKTFLLNECELIVETEADKKYPVVSAASIVAKVTRDRVIDSIRKYTGCEIGSGYMGDPTTVEFVEKIVEKKLLRIAPYYKIIRKTWEPVEKLVEYNKYVRLDKFMKLW